MPFIPAALQAFCLLRTRAWLAGFAPTRTTVRPGVTPRSALSRATSAVTSPRTFNARAFPSRIRAGKGDSLLPGEATEEEEEDKGKVTKEKEDWTKE